MEKQETVYYNDGENIVSLDIDRSKFDEIVESKRKGVNDIINFIEEDGSDYSIELKNLFIKN